MTLQELVDQIGLSLEPKVKVDLAPLGAAANLPLYIEQCGERCDLDRSDINVFHDCIQLDIDHCVWDRELP